MNKPDLQFGDGMTPLTGFTAAGVSAFSDLNYVAVVRELIQNSLDAALTDSKENCAKVRFKRFTLKLKDVPGISSYNKAFMLAAETSRQFSGGKMPTQVKLIVDRIGNTLEMENQEVLLITDNGIGLDKRRMSALLSDGISAKSGSSTGTYGNGHTVVIPASNLRYILYGGVSQNDGMLAAGQAILASHKRPEDNKYYSAHGLFINSFSSKDKNSLYDYPRGTLIPKLIKDALEEVQSVHGQGSAVIIPSFNMFEEENKSLTDIVFHAAACNFFQAIDSELLIVEVEDQIKQKDTNSCKLEKNVLNKKTLPKILARYKAEKKATQKGFLSGYKANESFQTLIKGKVYNVKTSQGEVQVCIRNDIEGKTSVGLSRNGMWITDHPPYFQNKFGDKQPFQALILLNPQVQNRLYNLVQEAETPLHNQLETKPMSKDGRRNLRNALNEICKWIHNKVPKINSESFTLNDIPAFQFQGSEAIASSRGWKKSYWGTPTSTSRFPQSYTGEEQGLSESSYSDQKNAGTKKRIDWKGKEKRRKVAVPDFSVVPIIKKSKKLKILIDPKQDCKNAELHLFVDENIDTTCDRLSSSEAVPLLLSDDDIRKNNEIISDVNLIKCEGGYNGIKLGNLRAGDKIIVEAKYQVPNDSLPLAPDNSIAVRFQIFYGKDN